MPGGYGNHASARVGRSVGLLSRRAALRTLFVCGVVSGTGATLAPVVASPTGIPSGAFDEMYRGRRIRGVYCEGRIDVTVDGRPLHLMRRADGGYLSMVDHYESHPTPLAATRAAVDELGTAQLSAGPAHRPWPRESRNGLHP
ncbi:tyrosinase cofactor [Streptomyces sannanensis]|uniref:Tyrosinase cofactor n=1 Tax=Streptomyces sannanensis TaxID=285536 RepID=A0ABP6SKV2_9ACTN